MRMTKPQLIDEIQRRNPTASEDFLAQFSIDELADYLSQLRSLPPEHGSVLVGAACATAAG
jgi:hypothetical protein